MAYYLNIIEIIHESNQAGYATISETLYTRINIIQFVILKYKNNYISMKI